MYMTIFVILCQILNLGNKTISLRTGCVVFPFSLMYFSKNQTEPVWNSNLHQPAIFGFHVHSLLLISFVEGSP